MEMYGTGSVSCEVVDFGISSVKCLGSATMVSTNWWWSSVSLPIISKYQSCVEALLLRPPHTSTISVIYPANSSKYS